MFITALHHAGLAILTHTPSPMAFLTKLLGRPENERPFCMFPIGYPADDCVVPRPTTQEPGRGDGQGRLQGLTPS